MGQKDAALRIGYSTTWIEIRAIEWPLNDLPVPGRIRYKYNPENGDRRYYVPDLDSFPVKRLPRKLQPA